MFGDRRVDHGFDALAITLRRAVRHFRAASIGLIDHQRDHLRHALERLRLVRRQGQERQEVLQERLFQRQRIFAADLQVEDVELVARRKLHRREDRLMPAVRPERLLDEAYEAFRRRADIELADQRQFRLGAAENRRRTGRGRY